MSTTDHLLFSWSLLCDGHPVIQGILHVPALNPSESMECADEELKTSFSLLTSPDTPAPAREISLFVSASLKAATELLEEGHQVAWQEHMLYRREGIPLVYSRSGQKRRTTARACRERGKTSSRRHLHGHGRPRSAAVPRLHRQRYDT